MVLGVEYTLGALFAGPGDAALVPAVGGLLGAYLVRGLLASYHGYLGNRLGAQLYRDLSSRVFRHVLRLDTAYFQSTRQGDVATVVLKDTQSVYALLLLLINTLARAPFLLAAYAGLLIYLSPVLAAVALLVLPFMAATTRALGSRIRRRATELAQQRADLTDFALGRLSAVEIIKSSDREGFEAERFAGHAEEFQRLSLRIALFQALLRPISDVIAACGLALLVWFGAGQVEAGAIDVATLLAFCFTLMMVYGPLNALLGLFTRMEQVMPSAERVLRALDNPVESEPGADAAAAPASVPELVFENVGFATGDRTVLQPFSVVIPAGTKVALVGPSGAGKTSLLRLLLRFAAPTTGRITAGGQDLQSIAPRAWRAGVGYAPQSGFALPGTVGENVGYRDPGATPESIADAARLARIHDYITGLPDGYDTRLDDQTRNFSRGQRQRIALARALAGGPGLLLLDEITASVDAESAREIVGSIQALKGVTIIMATHAPEAAAFADLTLRVDPAGTVTVEPAAPSTASSA
jgi:ABC-type multidrug transport system fused ATPase/permease subunit